MSITLPPMPVPTLIADSPAGHTAAYSSAQLRARDIEVARAVLEAIGIWLEHDEYGGWLVDELRAMEVFHD